MGLLADIAENHKLLSLSPYFADHSRYTARERTRVLLVTFVTSLWSTYIAGVHLTSWGKANVSRLSVLLEAGCVLRASSPHQPHYLTRSEVIHFLPVGTKSPCCWLSGISRARVRGSQVPFDSKSFGLYYGPRSASFLGSKNYGAHATRRRSPRCDHYAGCVPRKTSDSADYRIRPAGVHLQAGRVHTPD